MLFCFFMENFIRAIDLLYIYHYNILSITKYIAFGGV
jgi:hypothetical protein